MLTIRYTPGRVIAVGDIITEDVLNDLANPTIELEGTVSTASIADASITQAKLAPPILTADTPGWALMDDAYVIASKLAKSQSWTGFTLTGAPTIVWTGTIDLTGATLSLPTGLTTSIFRSSGTVLATGSFLDVAHGLVSAPDIMRLSLVCVTNNNGWVAGDEIDANCVSASPDVAESDPQAFTFGANSTNVFASLSTVDGSGYFMVSKTGSGRVAFTPAHWTAKVFAIKYI